MKRCGVRFEEREAGRVAYLDVLGARRITPPSAFRVVDGPGVQTAGHQADDAAVLGARVAALEATAAAVSAKCDAVLLALGVPAAGGEGAPLRC